MGFFSLLNGFWMSNENVCTYEWNVYRGVLIQWAHSVPCLTHWYKSLVLSYSLHSNAIFSFHERLFSPTYTHIVLAFSVHMSTMCKTEWNGNNTALGCIEPPIPSHVSLVQRTEHVLNFVCDSKYVFPDTAATSRELVCIRERHTWDKTLPNCVGK